MNTTNSKPAISFWIISILALLWNLMGVNQYFMMTYESESFKASLSPEIIALIEDTPAWSTAAFAIAVFAGALGSLALLLRKKIALTFFVISFIAIIVQNIDKFNRFKISDFNTMEITMTVMIPVIALFLIWYSKNSISKAWLK